MEYTDEEEHLNVGEPVQIEKVGLVVETPDEGKWAGTDVLPRDPDEVIKVYVERAKRTSNWMRTAVENMRYVDDEMVGLVKDAKAAYMRISRAWAKVTEANDMLSVPGWAESLPRKAGQMRTQRIDGMGRALVAVTELAEIWHTFASKYEEIEYGARRGVYG